MKRTISLMLVLAIAMVFVAGCGGSPEKKLEKAQAAMEKGDFDKAISILEDLAKDNGLAEDLKKQVDELLKKSKDAKKLADAVPALPGS